MLQSSMSGTTEGKSNVQKQPVDGLDQRIQLIRGELEGLQDEMGMRHKTGSVSWILP
eukprot:m.194865 g.194865  ORF g.194865 m.194865 type:complete len:57 (-) comp16996_c0_seq13:5300-5470(-)